MLLREPVERLVDLRGRDRQRRRRLNERAVDTRGNDEHATLERPAGVAAARAEQTAAVPAGALETLAQLGNVLEQPRHLGEDDERRRARERVARVRVRVRVLSLRGPELGKILAHEERRREREASAERRADAEDVRDDRTGPELAGPAE